MAADQRKRRVSCSYGSPEQQYRVKKRVNNDFSFNTHVSLKLDDSGKKVVAKEDQVGVAWRHLGSFLPGVAPCSNAKLADVVNVPKEVFELGDLAEVLDYEVWHSVLSEKERHYLSRFLPAGFDPDQVVEALLSGDNFHFGNSYLTWGSTLCSGGLHPDAILQHEKSFNTSKKAYYSELQQYHDSMIRNMLKLKQRCASSQDPETEILQYVARSRRQAEKTVLPDVNGFGSRNSEENVATVFECQPSSDDKLYYSDNQKLSSIRDAEIQRRRNEELLKNRNDKAVLYPSVSTGLQRPMKAEKLLTNDGAKYMSYVKISKKQHELFTSMKQSGSSIQSKTLNRVLGNLDSFNVKPYEMFVEEERKKIHDYWFNLATDDIPVAYLNWKNLQKHRSQSKRSLLQEMEMKLNSPQKDEKAVDCGGEQTANPQLLGEESCPPLSENNHNDETVSQGSILDHDKDSDLSSGGEDSQMQDSPVISNDDLDPSFMKNQCSVQDIHINVNEKLHPSITEIQSPMRYSLLNVNEELSQSNIGHQSSIQDTLLNVNKEFKPMDLNAEHNISSESSELRSMHEHQATRQPAEVPFNRLHNQRYDPSGSGNTDEIPSTSAPNIWRSVGMPESYRHSTTTQHASSSEASLCRSQGPEHPVRMIDLELSVPEEDTTKDFLNRHSHTSQTTFFSPYPNKDRSELLHSLIKRDSYLQEQKKTRLEFQPPTTNMLLEPSLFPSHLREQMQPSFALHHGQKTPTELFMHSNVQESIYPENNRYPVQSQDHFSGLNTREWSNARLSAPIQSSQLGSGELLNHNWFPSEMRPHGGWSSSDTTVFPNPSLVGGNTVDQGLYGVLSQYNTLGPQAHYSPLGSTQQIIPPANFRQDMAGVIPMTSNALPLTASPFDYISGSESATALKNNNIGWMSLGNQTSTFQDPSGKPYLKPWNP